MTGGYDCGRGGEDGIWPTAEIYDPATGTFSATGPMDHGREFHTATLLADGRVLIAGGYTAPPPAAAGGITLASVRTAESATSVLATAEIYDPTTGRFSKTGSMSTFRDHHTATRLDDGRVLVIGGGGEGYASSTSADVYDPATGEFSETGSMTTGRWLHTATLLADGRVLVLGGRSPQDSVYDSAELYDPRPARFSPAGSMGEGRSSTRPPSWPTGACSSPVGTGATARTGGSCPRPSGSTLGPRPSVRSARWARPAAVTPRPGSTTDASSSSAARTSGGKAASGSIPPCSTSRRVGRGSRPSPAVTRRVMPRAA